MSKTEGQNSLEHFCKKEKNATHLLQSVISLQSLLYSGFPVKLGIQRFIEFVPIQSYWSWMKDKQRINRQLNYLFIFLFFIRRNTEEQS